MDLTFSGAFPAQYLPPSSFTYSGINYTFPQYKSSGNDNVLCAGQNLSVPIERYSGLCILTASQSGQASGSIQAHYADGTTISRPVLVSPWWSWPYPSGGDIVFPHYLSKSGVDYNRSSIYQACTWLDSKKPLTSLTLPNIFKGSDMGPGEASIGTRLHIFSLSLIASPAKIIDGPRLNVRHARSTQNWMEGTNKTQIVEVTVANTGSGFILRNHSVSVEVQSSRFRTVRPGLVKRLAPGDQVVVEVGVDSEQGIDTWQQEDAHVVVHGLGIASEKYSFKATIGIQLYNSSDQSLSIHESPGWFNDAKFGIFIHWGVYAVPAWGNVGKNEAYAEWYVFVTSIQT
jgi:alpha-L-fucosidase